MNTRANDLKIVIDLELKLLDHYKRKEPAVVDTLLSEEFIEFGKSGRTHTKADVMTHLQNDPISVSIDAQNLNARHLSQEVILITYKSVERTSTALRSSIWQRNNNQWQMVFHQGTVTN